VGVKFPRATRLFTAIPKQKPLIIANDNNK
jgi:hypothetical protein